MRGKKIEKINDFRQFIILIILGLIIFFLAKTDLAKPFIGAFQVISVPVQTSFYQSTRGIGSFIETIAQIGSLRQENSDLSLQNSLLKAENDSLKMLKKENESLRAQLKTQTKDLKIIATARPIGNGAVGVKNVLLIDQGSANNIKNGDLVIIGNILIGQVIQVSPQLSSVQLLSDPDTKIPAITDTGAEGIIQGEFGVGIKLTDVVQEKVLVKGEFIKTSGRNSWPKGLVLGKIEKVNKVEKDFFQSADVVSTINLNDVSLVYVIRF